MATQTIRIATRKSPLALWQANYVAGLIRQRFPDLAFKLVELSTQGDREQSQPLTAIGGKSLFVKELQQALLDNEADLAVHCIKDMSVNPVPNLLLTAICNRGDPNDILIGKKLLDLADGAIVGTSSPRRQSLLLATRPDLQIKPLRGNINTRLDKLDQGDYDAIILAAAGVKRLGMTRRIADYLPRDHFIPAIGQGALGIECRTDDHATQMLVQHLNDSVTQTCMTAERAVNQILQGDCHTPIGANANFNEAQQLQLDAVVGSLDGKTILRANAIGPGDTAAELGKQVANELLKQGAAELIAAQRQ